MAGIYEILTAKCWVENIWTAKGGNDKATQRGAWQRVCVTTYWQADETEDTEMDGNIARRVHQRLMGKSESNILKQRAQLEDLGVDGRMKLVIDGGLLLWTSWWNYVLYEMRALSWLDEQQSDLQRVCWFKEAVQKVRRTGS